MVRTNGLKKHFKDPKTGIKKAVDGIDIEAKPGRIFGLLGVNGAGKTTVLRMLSTVIKPTAGSAEVNGLDVVADAQRVRASIGFMSNSTALYGRLTSREVIQYFGTLYGMDDARLAERMNYVLDKLEIHEFADRLCDKLSTGQKQRVSIARTILHDPPVLFFDEPTAGLDVVTSQTVMEFIEEARDLGKTVIFSTHIMSEVDRLCDDIAVIHDGIVVASGSPDTMRQVTEEKSLERAFLQLVKFQASYVSTRKASE
jgi:sodium transport system ATP-binding protein